MACLYLQECGLHPVARRYRLPGGEIDLVMKGAGVLVFVEVKVAGPAAAADPLERLRPAQLARLRRMARQYLAREGRPEGVWIRFDAVGVRLLGEGRGMVLDHRQGIT